jgi:hypothetical protein
MYNAMIFYDMERRDLMSDRITEGLKKTLYTGVGAAALAVDMAGKAVRTLSQRGEQAIEKGRQMNEKLKRKRTKPEMDIKDMAEVLGRMSREEIEAVRLKLSEIEKTMEKSVGEMKVSASAIMDSLEKMGRDELDIIKEKLEEIAAGWKDDGGDDDQRTGG